MTDTESTDENSNVIYKLKETPKRKSTNKQSKRIIETPSTGKDCLNENPKSSLKYSSILSSKSQSQSSRSTLRSWHTSPAPQPTSVSRKKRDQKEKVEAKKNCQIEGLSKKSNICSSPQSSNTDKRIEPTLCKISSPQGAGTTQNLLREKRSELNQRDYDILNELRFDVQMLTKSIDQLRGIVERSVLAKDAHGANVKSFATEYDLKLPVTTLEQFDEFDGKLKTDKNFCKEFASTLHFIIDCHNATFPKNITALLKKHISRDVALNFNAVKVGKDKRIFKDTRLCGIMLDVLLLKYKDQGSSNVTEKSFYRELGNCLSDAIDWDGHRKSRSKKQLSAKRTASVSPQTVRSHSNTSIELSQKSSD